MKKSLFVLIALVTALAVAPRAEANDGQTAEIYGLIQQGQDVEITLSLYDWGPGSCFGGDPSAVRTLDLAQTSSMKNRTVRVLVGKVR